MLPAVPIIAPIPGSMISANSLSDLRTNNSVSISPLESIAAGKDIVEYLLIYLLKISVQLQLRTQDFLQDLKIVWLNKTNMVANEHLAYQMTPPEKPDIIFLQNRKVESYNSYVMFDLIIDQRHLVSEAYASLNPTACGQMFDCFVDQDVVAAPLDLYHSITFENQSINESEKDFFGRIGAGYLQGENIFYQTSLYRGSIATKVYYPNNFILAWKMATDNSFMRGYNSSKIGGRSNIQVILQGSLTPVTFDDAPDPQVLTLDVIGELGGAMVRAGQKK
ncbi:MAG: hypothetical protein EZS28_010375 [Streblomastix strix]|uniref:Uncharacterized protein n=1 Tax=Streblomastix strix TaxID=222440 RepID=A0A5J4WGE5_9EUKA|nr:MAG: hypothetical protein EZS28_010375 [Streblomastix strix]